MFRINLERVTIAQAAYLAFALGNEVVIDGDTETVVINTPKINNEDCENEPARDYN